MKKVFIYSDQAEVGKNTLIYNLALKISSKLSNTVIISQSPSVESQEKINKNLSVYYVNADKNIKREKDLIAKKKLFLKNVNYVSKKKAYCFIESSLVDINYNQLILSISTDVILIYNANHFNSDQVLKDLSFIKNSSGEARPKLSCIILNGYDKNNSIHLSNLLILRKTFKTLVYVIPYNNQLNKNFKTSRIFLEKNPWSDFAIILDEIIKTI